MCAVRAVRSIVASLIAVLVLGAVPAYPWDGIRGVTALALDPQAPSTIYAGTFDRGLFKSRDGGTSWNATGLTNGPVEALAVDALAPATIYAAVSDAGVFKSTDGGATWSSTGLASGSVRFLVIDPITPTTLYAAIPDVGVFRSTDGGATWNTSLSLEWYPYPSIQGLVIDAHTPSTLYAAVAYQTSEYSGGDVLGTSDGANWWPIFSDYWIQALAIDTQVPINLYAANDANTVHHMDGNGNWSSHPTGLSLPFEGLALAVDPLVPTTVYMSSYNGLFKSTDRAVTWSALTCCVGTLAIDPVTSTTLYVGTGAGLLKSQDGGAHWTPTGLYQQSPLAFVSLDPVVVLGGTPSTGTVTLMTAAPEGGVTVTLSSSHPAAVTVPASVTVAAGATSANFTVSTIPATSWANVTISGISDDAIRYATLFVAPATVLSSVTLNPATVTGGGPSTGTVTLSGPAPPGGAVVSLGSSQPTVATVEGSVTVPAGSTTANFQVSTTSVDTSTSVSITGSYHVVKFATLTMTPASTLASVSLDPSTVQAGGAATGTVILTAGRSGRWRRCYALEQ
jgi:hypothetical protein